MKDTHPSIFLKIQRHLLIHLDEKLDFNPHIKTNTDKTDAGIALIRKLQNKLPRNAILNIYKSFLRPHLDYGDFFYDQPANNSFGKKVRKHSIQCHTSHK